MSGWTKAMDTILQEQVAATGVRALVVEGEDDKMVVEAQLERLSSGTWETRWCVGVAKGKQNVLRIVDDQPDWLGLVDRDEWSDNAAITASQHPARIGRLHVLPRFSMESYFIDPVELWAALPPIQQQLMNGGQQVLDAAISNDLDSWLRHGALWHTVNPLWDGLRALGFKESLLNHANAQSDALIQQTLADWHQFLEPQTIFAEFQAHLSTARATSRDVQFRRWIHGKRFFRERVVPSLNQLLGQKSPDVWYRDLSQTLPLPTDFEPLWAAMGLP